MFNPEILGKGIAWSFGVFDGLLGGRLWMKKLWKLSNRCLQNEKNMIYLVDTANVCKDEIQFRYKVFNIRSIVHGKAVY